MKYFIKQQTHTHSPQAHMELRQDEILGHKAHLDKFKRTDNYKLCLQTIIDLNSKLITDDS